MTEHVLKSIPPYFEAILSGDKTFDVRINDRGFQRGDVVFLNEWCTETTTVLRSCERCAYIGDAKGHYTKGSEPISRRITYVFSGDPRFGGVESGHVVLALQPMPECP